MVPWAQPTVVAGASRGVNFPADHPGPEQPSSANEEDTLEALKATARRMNEVTKIARGAATEKQVTDALHKHINAGNFNLRQNADEPWAAYEFLQTVGWDCVSLSLILQAMQKQIGVPHGKIRYIYASTKEFTDAIPTPEGKRHIVYRNGDNANAEKKPGSNAILHTDVDIADVSRPGASLRGDNKWEAVIMNAYGWYPGGFESVFDAPWKIQCDWLQPRVDGKGQRVFQIWYDSGSRANAINPLPGPGFAIDKRQDTSEAVNDTAKWRYINILHVAELGKDKAEKNPPFCTGYNGYPKAAYHPRTSALPAGVAPDGGRAYNDGLTD
jgi:hypothetical protein